MIHVNGFQILVVADTQICGLFQSRPRQLTGIVQSSVLDRETAERLDRVQGQLSEVWSRDDFQVIEGLQAWKVDDGEDSVVEKADGSRG